MKFISVTILLICLIAATFSQWLLIACFDLNKNYIAKELCVNKNNPSAHCNGHCYLNKELNNEEKSSNPLNRSEERRVGKESRTRWTGDWSSDVCSSDLSSVSPYC